MSSKIGRPRSFDPDKAVEQAMRQFWEHGYEGTSLSDLTKSMGIARTSLYAAFGSKEELFRLAMRRYSQGPASYAFEAIEKPTARGVAEAFLWGAAEATTRSDCPSGCLGVQASLATSDEARSVRNLLTAWREDAVRRLSERFRQAIDEGDLPSEAQPETLARFVMTLANGIAVQASGGSRRIDLQRVADGAMRAWPLI